jgi:antitoxin component of MazEF toxin-antitoxin module
MMSRVTVGTWGKSLAVRVPLEVARAAGLISGEQVEVETKDGDIVIRRSHAQARARANALAALDRIIENSKGVALGDVTIRELIDEGRRG